VQKVFVLKHVGVNDMGRILSVFPAAISGAERDGMRALSVSANPAVMAAIEETIKRLDVPQPPAKSVEVTGYVLECSAQRVEGAPALPELDSVIAQLKRTFGYSGCSLAQTLFARARDDANFNTLSSEESASGSGTTSRYTLNARVSIDAERAPAVVRFRRLRYSESPLGNDFSGDIDVRDGQKVILGKVGSGPGGRDQILLLTAKVVD
jgi:hypothetical protein